MCIKKLDLLIKENVVYVQGWLLLVSSLVGRGVGADVPWVGEVVTCCGLSHRWNKSKKGSNQAGSGAGQMLQMSFELSETG